MTVISQNLTSILTVLDRGRGGGQWFAKMNLTLFWYESYDGLLFVYWQPLSQQQAAQVVSSQSCLKV